MYRAFILAVGLLAVCRISTGDDATPPDGKWELQKEHNFATDADSIRKTLAPWYTAQFEGDSNTNNDHHGILLAAETGHQHYCRITERAPHALRWELHIEMSWEGGFERR